MTGETPPPGRIRLAPGVHIDPGLLSFRTSRSSGPGGQNVNKRETKVELRVAVADLPLTASARARLVRLAGDRATEAGEILLVCEETRSQKKNRELAIARLAELVVKAHRPPPKRIRTKPTKSSKRRRVDEKVKRGKLKRERGRNRGDSGDE